MEDLVLGVAANDEDNAVVCRVSGLCPGDGGLGKGRDGLHPLVEGGLVDLYVSQEQGPVHIIVSGRSTSLAQWFNKYHAGLEVMGSIPMGDFHI